MKKFFGMLMMAAMVFSLTAMAGLYDVYSLEENGLHPNEFPILEPEQYDDNGTLIYKASGMTVNYNVSGSINRILEDYDHNLYSGRDKTGDTGITWHYLAKVTFTTNENVYLGLWTDIDGVATNEPRVDLDLNVSDYGIYFIDENPNPNGEITARHSLKNGGIEVAADREFGVYYENIENGEAVIYTTTGNWVGSFDGRKSEDQGYNHTAADEEVWFAEKDIATREAFFCMFHGEFYADQPAHLEWEHFEFGFALGEQPAGQPLPGTLATILISGLCAAGLRKKSKKN